MSTDRILGTRRLGFPWATSDPFLFCAYHNDAYPRGNARLGPDASLVGRDLGRDFTVRDGFRMYHGRVVPGFPQHPHRGFETITVARRGFINHSDSLGATARYGEGDVQWMTAGRGIVHAEMFPLVHRDRANPAELFQIWLNLPASDKMVPPHFEMFWSEHIPRRVFRDADDRETEVVVVAGFLDDMTAPAPPPSSWASRAEARVAIWTLKLAAGARWTLPPASPGLSRTLYLFNGQGIAIAGQPMRPSVSVQVRSDVPIDLENGFEETELLMLQGRPIGEPVAHQGPFVMNTQAELRQAYDDYRRTRFGGWPWKRDNPVHAGTRGRFAVHADGRKDKPS